MGVETLAHDEVEGTLTGGAGHGLLTLPDGKSIGAQFHPLCAMFPPMGRDEFDALVEDVKANGVRRPVVLFDGMILDGRHRYLAARECGAGYRTVEFTGTDPVAFVISENLQRRHLNTSQRAMIAAKLANMPRGRPSDNSADLRISSTADEAAERLNVSPRMVETARTVEREAAPEVRQMVEVGEVSATAAADVSMLPVERQAEIAAEGPKAVRDAAREVRQTKTRERWEGRVEAVTVREPDDDTLISIALHLAVRGTRAEVVDVLAAKVGVLSSSLALAAKGMTRSPDEARRVDADLRRIIEGVTGQPSTVHATAYDRVVEVSIEESDARARRRGWAAAVLGRGLDECPTDGVSAQAWRAGFTDFTDTFVRFMEGR